MGNRAEEDYNFVFKGELGAHEEEVWEAPRGAWQSQQISLPVWLWILNSL